MIIRQIRVYAEVLEQGFDFRNYIRAAGFTGTIVNAYAKKTREEFTDRDSIIDRIRKVKDVDILISAISGEEEYPLLIVEYSTAVPTDDHKMQRSDVYYWGAVFCVPVMKISPTDKGIERDFGGGSRITDEQEQRLAFDRGALLFPIKWETPEGYGVLPTKENALSCIPYSQNITETLSMIISVFDERSNYADFYDQLKTYYAIVYSDRLNNTPISEIRRNISNSKRFHWYGNKLSVKVNRFGHAMDPDRGILYYANMLVGATNTITEIQVNRPDILTYNKLFDALARKRELLNYVTNIINTANNVFSDEDALYVFTHGLNIENAIRFDRIAPHVYRISDDVLTAFLNSHPSIVAKTIFFLSTELKLTDKNRDTICSIQWSEAPIRSFLEGIYIDNRTPLRIRPLSFNKAKEDIITFASVELYKKLGYNLIAVSYPGAQGDRCILTGSGRSVSRTYVDIIAYKAGENGIQVFLEECKDKFSESYADVQKLKNITLREDKREGLKLLLRKTIHRDDIIDVYTSIAAKANRNIPHFFVDYVFMFNLTYDEHHTYIDYTVEVGNMSLESSFLPLSDNGRLEGRLSFDRIYIVE